MNKPENSIPITHSNSPEAACETFLEDVKKWAHLCVDKYGNEPALDCHDQLTYTTGWEPYLLACQDKKVVDFLKSEQEKTAAHFNEKDLWNHGYWRMQEAHHGTEHYELFLGFISRVLPGNSITNQQMVHAAEHMGNWCKDVDEWFDYSTGLFRSLYFGTDGIREDKTELNMPDHLRCANILMLAYEIKNDPKYLELAESYSELWATAICNPETSIPIGITRDGVLYELSGEGEETYRSFAGMAGNLEDDLDRAENILASGGIQLFLKLWKETGKEVFSRAVETLLSVLAEALDDPDAGPAADAIRLYRRVTGKKDFDHQILDTVNKLSPFDIKTIGISLPANLDERPSGIGKRTDVPVWYENDLPRKHNPILLSVAAEIKEDQKLATQAVDLARTYFSLATQMLPDGRQHGCAARTVSAIARGHGRNNHAGMNTAVLLPIMQYLKIL